MGKAWIGTFLGFLSSHFLLLFRLLELWDVSPRPCSFFTTLTSLSAPHTASGIIAVRLGSPLPDPLQLHLGPVLGLRGHTPPQP